MDLRVEFRLIFQTVELWPRVRTFALSLRLSVRSAGAIPLNGLLASLAIRRKKIVGTPLHGWN